MNDFKAGDRVEYIGNTWSHRIGDLGSVVAESSRGQSMVRIVFDGETGDVGAYPKSLRLVNRPSVITIDRADLPEVHVSDVGNGFVTALAQENFQPQLRRLTEDGIDGAWNRKIAYANLAIAIAVEAREKAAEETAAAEKEAAEMLTKRRDELAKEVAKKADWVGWRGALFINHQTEAQAAIDMMIIAEANRG